MEKRTKLLGQVRYEYFKLETIVLQKTILCKRGWLDQFILITIVDFIEEPNYLIRYRLNYDCSNFCTKKKKMKCFESYDISVKC